jgi:hypothetical protein
MVWRKACGLATAHADGAVRFWDANTAELKKEHPDWTDEQLY